MKVRTPAVAGAFYPDNSDDLRQSIRECFLHRLGPGRLPPGETQKIFGIICPHAGYVYSGPIACNSFYAISGGNYDLFVIVGPNHWGIGSSIATLRDCIWETPLGEVKIDYEAATQLSKTSDLVEIDFFSHTKEHSLEVQVPMLQETFSKEFSILPISMINQTKQASLELGKSIAKIVTNKKAMIIGSSDFTHYESNEFAHKQDRALIKPILQLDIDEFYNVLESLEVTACGYGAIATTMTAVKELGAKKGILLRYATSGDVTGQTSSVVGYGSIVFI